MNRFCIRDFVFSDLDSLTTLTNELGYPSTVEEMEKRMKSIVLNKNYKTFVAVSDGMVVGYCGAFLYDCWEHNEQIMRIEVLVVDSQTRRAGIGKELITSAEVWAAEHGVKISSLNSGNRAERESAHEFYPRLGYEARSTGYSKKM